MVIKSNITHSSLDEVFKLSPLAACIRVAIAGGLLMSPMMTAQAEDAASAHLSAALEAATGLPTPQDAATANYVSHHGTVETVDISGNTSPTTLNWQDFNIAAGHTVDFKEHDSSSIALNNIHQGDASQILGNITANGQVYLYNQNGFLFGKDSVVDTHALVASSLNISDAAFTRNQPGLGGDGAAVNKNSLIKVESGAKIIARGNDGLVILAGPTVENDGAISADNYGQVILVASQDKVYLHAADIKSPFHGLVVEVGTGGKVTNVGDVLAKQGNITMAGFIVNQEGRLTATTSVNENGSIRLLAEEGGSANADGTLKASTTTVRSSDLGDGLGVHSSVNMGSASHTDILLDDSAGTATDAQAQPQSLIQVVADKVDLQGKNGSGPGASIIAPGAKVSMIATTTPGDIDPISGQLIGVTHKNGADAGRVLLEQGSSIDVSGIQNIQVAMARNEAAISVQSYDLRDSPLQKSGPLLGTTVYVDLRQATSIVDISGSQARIARSVEERLGNGGAVNIVSDGDVIVDKGAAINISGGSIDYQSGYVHQSQLIDQFGRLVNISQADPNQIYTSVAGVIVEHHDKWITDPNQYIRYYTPAYSQGRYEQGYVQGLNAGSVNIVTPQLMWAGDLQAHTVSGPYQRDAGSAPTGGAFNFNVANSELQTFDITLLNAQQNIAFVSANSAVQAALQWANLGINDAIPVSKGSPADLLLSQDFVNKSGLQKISVQTLSGNASIAADVTLQPSLNLASAGSLTLQAKNIDVQGNIYLPSGNVNLLARDLSSDDANSTVTVSAHSSVDVSGRWVNDFQQGNSSVLPVSPKSIDGGNVHISSQGNVFLNAGSSIKADGGAWNSQTNTLTAGKGGGINLESAALNTNTARLHLDGQLSAYGLAKGGTLTLNSSTIMVSGTALPVTDDVLLLTANANGNLAVAQNSGFSAINLESNKGVLAVTGDVNLHLIQQNRQLQGNYYTQASGASIAGFSTVQTLPDALRGAVNLNLSGYSGVTMATGSAIVADNNATVSLTSLSQGGVFVDGTINTPGGSINLLLKGDSNNSSYESNKAIWLGDHAQLLAQGSVVYNIPDQRAITTGNVLKGGTVTLEADRGYVVLHNGSLIDVSGSSAMLDLPKANSAGTLITGYQPTKVGSDAGQVNLTAAGGMVLDGKLSGFAGSSTNKNGQLDVTLTNGKDNVDRSPGGSGASFPAVPQYVININQNQPVLLDGKLNYGDNLDNYLKDHNSINTDGSLYGKATITSDLISQGGFDDIRLVSDVVNFSGNVDLTVKSRFDATASIISWSADANSGDSAGAVNLNTAYLNIASPVWTPTTTVSPLHAGKGSFTSNAVWTDLTGATVWNGFADLTLNNQHELRGIGQLNTQQSTVNGNTIDVYAGYIGSLTTSANINLKASQIYPTTLSQFSFNVDSTLNPTGTINITGNNNRDASPLSANGTLSFNASVINQDGVLKAPFGTIALAATNSLTLGADSLTSVSGAGLLVPFGTTLGGKSWVFPYSQYSLVYNSKPDYNPIQNKQVHLSSPAINLSKGSVVDISGGGDLVSYEFRTGIGGTNDYLAQGSASYNGGFAIVPALASSLLPYDPLLNETQLSLYQAGSSVYLNGGNGVAAGVYTIMPASYALLPGAYLVTPVSNSQDTVVNSQRTDGVPIVSGYYTDTATGTKDARSSAFMIENGTQIRSHSSYAEYTANSFFNSSTNTSLLPKDSGQLLLEAQNELLLQGTIKSTAASGGKGAKVDIAAANIDVVKQLSAQPTPNQLQILASDLNNLNVDSLFLGGTRSRDNVTGDINLNVGTDTVTIENGVTLVTKDLLLAANLQVEVKKDVVLTASGAVNTGDKVFNVLGNGALLRVSEDQQVTVNRKNFDGTVPDGTTGDLLIDAGSTINVGSVTNASGAALQSVLLDASHASNLSGKLIMQGGALSLNVNGVDLGDAIPGDTGTALALSNAQLADLKVDTLVINSGGAINVYGNVGHIAADGSVTDLQFKNLTLNASGFSGFDNAGKSAHIHANSLTVQNPSGVSNTTVGNGSGELFLSADSYTQGAGNFAITGFKATDINISHKDVVGNAFTADGKSSLTVAGDLNVIADYLTATGGSNMAIDATGHQANFNAAGASVKPVVNEYGGQISVVADGINFNSQVSMPSGKLVLEAKQNDLTVGSKAQIDLAGRADYFADSVQYTSGGTFSAIADLASVHLKDGSAIDLNGGGGTASGGTLILKAPHQSVELSGKIKAAGGSTQIDQATYYGTANFDTVMQALSTAGITNSISFRTRDADIAQAAGQQVLANSIKLVADKGTINLAGTLNASGSQGGAINLYAGNAINLLNGSRLLAKGATGNGGTVLLSSLASSSHALSVQKGASIDVSGAAKGGDVTLRALRNGTGVNIDPVMGTVGGYRHFYAEAVKQYGNADFITPDQIDDALVAQIQTDTDTYMQTAQVNLGAGIVLRPGVEIDYQGSLALVTNWDLLAWKYNGVAGDLVIKASDGLAMQGSLSDGFANDALAADRSGETVKPVNSWSYQLVSGADVNSADTLATIKASADELAAFTKDLTIGNGSSPTYIRTGSGSIALASGGNIVISDQYATVYVGGRISDTNPYGTTGSLAGNSDHGIPTADYPVDGGSFNVYTDNNIVGTFTDQVINNLINTPFAQSNSPGNIHPSLWGINNFSNFAENFGSFGGGAVNIRAGGSITDLSVIMPTSGKQIGTPKLDASGHQMFDANGYALFVDNKLEINGGGSLSVSANGDINGGLYYLGQGSATITSGGQITGGSQFTSGPQLLLGNSNISLQASNGVELSAVSDPLVAAGIGFYSYTGTSGIAVSSLAGDVQLGTDNSIVAAANGFTGDTNRVTLSNVYPASLQAVAYGGNVLLGNINLFPSTQSNVAVLARDGVTGIVGQQGSVSMLDIPVDALPNAYSPGFIGTHDPATIAALFSFPVKDIVNNTPYTTNAPILHANDNQNAYVVTQKGDINGIKLYIAKSGIVKAARDIVNINVTLQNNNASNVSVVSAGRDITNPADLNSIGTLDSSSSIAKIAINGPGEFLVTSGRNTDLGLSDGIISYGNLEQSNLAKGGANLTVIAGLNESAPNYTGFINYLSNLNKTFTLSQSSIAGFTAHVAKEAGYAPTVNVTNCDASANCDVTVSYGNVLADVNKIIGDFVRALPGNGALTDAQAMTVFAGLSPDSYLSIQPQLNAALSGPLYDELILAGSASAADKSAGNASGFAAINELFPGSNWSGDLSLIFSTIQTQQGGDINLLVPGGSIDAGLPFAFPGLTKSSADLGIITQSTGNINVFANSNFEVNQSRVFTQGGGDILLWSSAGNIDAGRGAKSALSVPLLSVDYQNNLKRTSIQPALSGSGIRAAANYGLPSGNAYLFAPGGVVNAGEAGIGANNVTISATAVIGANNIQVGGVGTGVPAASASVAAGLTGVSNVAANVTQVAQAAIDSADDGKSKNKHAAMGVLSVEVLASNKCKDPHGCKN